MRLTEWMKRNRAGRLAAALLAAAAVLVQVQQAAAYDAGLPMAGYGSDGSWELDEEEINYKYEPAPFTLKLIFDDKTEWLTKKITKDWRSRREDGVYVWNDEAMDAYLDSIKGKYETQQGKVAFTTHDGINKIFDSENCGWHLNNYFTEERIKEAVETGADSALSAWNSGLDYCSDSDVGHNYIEVDIARQKVYLFENSENVFEADCVTGTIGTTDTATGVFQVANKSAPAVLSDTDKSGNKYEQPVNYWVCFNPMRGMGFHDAPWRGGFGGDIYKSWGSHGCVNMAEEDAKRIYEEAFIYMPVIVY